MNKIDVAKKIVSAVVGSGTTRIVYAIIQNNVSPEKIVDKVTVVSASLVIGAMAADATSSYTDTKIDALIEWFQSIKTSNDTLEAE